MKRMMRSIMILGCVTLIGNASIAHAEEAPAADDNDGRILTINFIGERSSAVTLYYKLREDGAGARSAVILMESLKRKLTEEGFERSPAEDDWQDAIHDYSVFIIVDAGYSKETHSLEKREGHLTALIVENEKLAVVNGAPAQGNEMEYRQIETMADEIVKRLVFHSYI